MSPVLESDSTIIVEEIDDLQATTWSVWVGSERSDFDNWHSAYEDFLDHIKFWLGYYIGQRDNAAEIGLTWTVETYSAHVKDYERWIEYLQSIEDEPQGLNFIGSNRKLSINPRKNSEQV